MSDRWIRNMTTSRENKHTAQAHHAGRDRGAAALLVERNIRELRNTGDG
jgi:hypothetical protein